MKLIKPSFEIIEQEFPVQKLDMSAEQHKEALLDAMYKHIELCGRTCYKSTDKITEDSAKPFVDRMVASKHYAMLEHGTVYLKKVPEVIADKYAINKFSIARYFKHDHVIKPCVCDNINEDGWYVTTNFRVIVENGWFEDLQYICSPTKYHAKRHTVKFICNRQVSHEFVRHRVFSFAQESTRYCNYTKGRFGGELTFIEPCWHMDMEDKRILNAELSSIEATYFRLINKGWKPQQAATILPNALKTELIMTGFEEDWKHFFDLRALGTTGAPHPQAQELAMPLYKEFVKLNYITENGNE